MPLTRIDKTSEYKRALMGEICEAMRETQFYQPANPQPARA